MDGSRGAALPTTPWRFWSADSRAEVVFLLGEQRAAERVAKRLFGRVLDCREYAGLAGAPDDAKIEVGASGGRLYIEMRDPVAATYCGYYYLYYRKPAVVLLSDGFHIHVQAMRGHGLGLQIFHRQTSNAAALRVDWIDTVAGRENDENGYYTWPRYGFQGVLPAPIRRLLPVGFEHARTILDLMSCEKGRNWWREYGVTIRVRFDLAPDSRSRRTLVRYIGNRMRGSPPLTSARQTV